MAIPDVNFGGSGVGSVVLIYSPDGTTSMVQKVGDI